MAAVRWTVEMTPSFNTVEDFRQALVDEVVRALSARFRGTSADVTGGFVTGGSIATVSLRATASWCSAGSNPRRNALHERRVRLGELRSLRTK